MAQTGQAQKISLDQFKAWKPRNIGPAGMSGRVTSVDVVVNNPNVWYVGCCFGRRMENRKCRRFVDIAVR
jgi:hypothetical protein